MKLSIVATAIGTTLLLGAGIIAFAPEPAPAAVGARDRVAASASPAVLELFTSQGCSSCPPADEVAERLAQRADVIVISRPVTYWDRLGWKDTLASPVNTDLQRAYAARRLAGENGVFTPQVVIDGSTGTIGSRQHEIEGLISRAAGQSGPAIAIGADGQVTVSGGLGKTGRLTLVGMDSRVSVAIGSGENGKRRITYTNVYKGETDLGAWQGGSQHFALPATARQIAGADRFVLLLREGKTGPILAAQRI